MIDYELATYFCVQILSHYQKSLKAATAKVRPWVSVSLLVIMKCDLILCGRESVYLSRQVNFSDLWYGERCIKEEIIRCSCFECSLLVS